MCSLKLLNAKTGHLKTILRRQKSAILCKSYYICETLLVNSINVLFISEQFQRKIHILCCISYTAYC